MRMFTLSVIVLCPVVLAGGFLVRPTPADSSPPPKKDPAPADPAFLELTGRTQCVPGKKGIIAPVPLHPVVEILVRPGDRVKKDQPLVKIDDDEPQADTRVKKAAVDSAKATAAEARRYLQKVEELATTGAVSETTLHNARLAKLKGEADERSAQAALESSKAELEHYTVQAAIDGVVSWLDVHPGTVSRPGTTVWGEILDLSEIDVRCDVTPEQADRLTTGQAAAVRTRKQGAGLAGKVVLIGISADKQTGLVPVVIRLPNTKGVLRCEVPVQVRLGVSP